MKKIIVSESGLTRLERNIAPLMRAAITLPVEGSGIVVYVGIGQFGPGATIQDLCETTQSIVLALKAYNPEAQS